ncbi:DNA-3-methyladenine glycosylase [Bdellovibrio sp. HCB337]|uniref:DNA-3-methyladenine glycosylase n=1 Tax=Bdellovibrio sp. HCB337 TaxID=3394358 RepID=UPI0039A4EC3D
MILEQEFYFQKTDIVAERLLGKVLHFKNEEGEVLSGRIVETEAYMGIADPACHTFGGRRTERTSSMYLAGGYSYVYLIYGMYYCLNFVTRTEEEPEAVLIRALEPVHIPGEKPAKKHLHTNGPGKLCRHLGITKKQNALPLWKKRSGLWVEDDGFKTKLQRIHKTTRVGVDYAGAAAKWPLRYYLKESPWISRP